MTAQKGRTYDRTAPSGETSEKALVSGAVPHMTLRGVEGRPPWPAVRERSTPIRSSAESEVARATGVAKKPDGFQRSIGGIRGIGFDWSSKSCSAGSVNP